MFQNSWMRPVSMTFKGTRKYFATYPRCEWKECHVDLNSRTQCCCFFFLLRHVLNSNSTPYVRSRLSVYCFSNKIWGVVWRVKDISLVDPGEWMVWIFWDPRYCVLYALCSSHHAARLSHGLGGIEICTVESHLESMVCKPNFSFLNQRKVRNRPMKEAWKIMQASCNHYWILLLQRFSLLKEILKIRGEQQTTTSYSVFSRCCLLLTSNLEILHPCSMDLPLDILAHKNLQIHNNMDILVLVMLTSKQAWISMSNIHASWTYTWIPLLKNDQQIPPTWIFMLYPSLYLC